MFVCGNRFLKFNDLFSSDSLYVGISEYQVSEVKILNKHNNPLLVISIFLLT